MAALENPSSSRGAPFHYPAILGLAVLETAYFLIMFNPGSQHVDPGLMFIFAAECSFMYKVATDNVAEKRAFGATSSARMLYTRVAGISLLALMAFSSGYIRIPGLAFLCVVLSWSGAFGKAMWIRSQPNRTAV